MKILEENISLIATFIGYKYHESNILEKDEYEVYRTFEIFSKVPILVDYYGEDPNDIQVYFSNLPNPDYKKKESEEVFWNTDLQELSWSSLNFDKYKTKEELVKYFSDWEGVMELVELVEGVFIVNDRFRVTIDSAFVRIGTEEPIERRVLEDSRQYKKEILLECIVEFIQWYNKQDDSKKLQHYSGI